MSVGLCELTNEKTPDEIINKADKLMYENKKRAYNSTDLFLASEI